MLSGLDQTRGLSSRDLVCDLYPFEVVALVLHPLACLLVLRVAVAIINSLAEWLDSRDGAVLDSFPAT